MAKRLGWYVIGSCLLLTVAALLAACGASGEVEVGASDDGRQLTLQAGQILVVSLESNPTTGYSWARDGDDESVLKQVGEAEFKAESELLGAGGLETLRFEAVGKGEATLTLVYQRPWETGIEPLETFTLQVVVQ